MISAKPKVVFVLMMTRGIDAYPNSSLWMSSQILAQHVTSAAFRGFFHGVLKVYDDSISPAGQCLLIALGPIAGDKQRGAHHVVYE
ncbi:hypothetical protein D3C85_1762070 [compost metagenome]